MKIDIKFCLATISKGKYIYKDDVLRFENVSEKELKTAFEDF